MAEASCHVASHVWRERLLLALRIRTGEQASVGCERSTNGCEVGIAPMAGGLGCCPRCERALDRERGHATWAFDESALKDWQRNNVFTVLV